MSKQSTIHLNEDGLILSGYQKKLNTMKKKYFVLYREYMYKEARLEYYDNEKKFNSGLAPKRVIKLKNCFNINRRYDTKHDYVIALSTKDGTFGIVLETEEEMLKWLEVLISLQRCDDKIIDSGRPHFEHVWQVLVQRKGLAEDKGIVGSYHVCLTPKSVTFIRIGPEKTSSGETRIVNIEFFLTTIRRCGDSQCFFYMEVGRQSITGAGELWMETEDSLIAQNMHHMILSAMSSKGELINMEPMRKRSSSANEASKPQNVLYRKQSQADNKTNNSPQTAVCFGRERCDSLPSRNRTTSDCSNPSLISGSVLTARNILTSGLRPLSYQRHSNSPPISSTITCSESEESSISIDEPDDNGSFMPYRFNSRTSEGVILEENTDELLNSDNKWNDLNTNMDIDNLEENYVSMAPVKNVKDLSDAHKLHNLHNLSMIDDSTRLPSLCSLNSDSPKSEIKFPEYACDAVGGGIKAYLLNDATTQCDRPQRAYSIGNKIEHNKIVKRLKGHTNEDDQNTTRVRAFSVGSRAKIPRCDLQCGALFPKSLIEQKLNSSNNNICSVNDVATYNQLLNLNAYRDKKSTSAPLLIHKSHNSVDRMSDLMEIDFSKTAHNTNTNRIFPSTGKSQLLRAVHSNNTSHIREQEQQYRQQLTTKSKEATSNTHFIFENGTPDDCFNTYAIKPTPSTSSCAKTDNGYLEMKPVGSNSVLNNMQLNSNCASTEYVTNKPKIGDNMSTSLKKQHQSLPSNIHSTVLANPNSVFKSNHAAVTAIKRNNSNTECNTSFQDYKKTTEPINIPQRKIEQDTILTATATPACYSSATLRKLILGSEKPIKESTQCSATTESTPQPVGDLKYGGNRNVAPSTPYAPGTHAKLIPQRSEKEYINEDHYINLAEKFDEHAKISTVSAPQILQQQTSSKPKSKFYKKGGYDKLRLTHSNSDEDHKYETHHITSATAKKSFPSTIDNNETGYEILQIKSDSSLQSSKLLQRPALIRKEKDKEESRQMLSQIRHSAINSPKPMLPSSTSSLSSTLCLCSSSSPAPCTSCQRTPDTPNVANDATPSCDKQSSNSSATNSSNNKIQSNATTITSTTNVPDVAKRELYYASLDLPQCSSEVTPKPKQTDNLGDHLHSPLTAVFNVNNTYAKIDFDHSDSSSSSIKNLNI